MRQPSLTRVLMHSLLLTGLTVFVALGQVNLSLRRLPLHVYLMAALTGIATFALQSMVRHIPPDRPRSLRMIQYGFSWGIPMMCMMSPTLSLTGGWHDPGRVAVFLGVWSIGSLGYGFAIGPNIEASTEHKV